MFVGVVTLNKVFSIEGSCATEKSTVTASQRGLDRALLLVTLPPRVIRLSEVRCVLTFATDQTS